MKSKYRVVVDRVPDEGTGCFFAYCPTIGEGIYGEGYTQEEAIDDLKDTMDEYCDDAWPEPTEEDRLAEKEDASQV